MDNYNYQPDNNQSFQNEYPQGAPVPGQPQPGQMPGGQNPYYNNPQGGVYPGQGNNQPYQGYQGPVVINSWNIKKITWPYVRSYSVSWAEYSAGYSLSLSYAV